MDSPIIQILAIVIFIYSVIAHEVMHGAMADYLGDPTARYMGRLSFNPLVHIDVFGSILVPLLLLLSHSRLLGCAKPVPYNPYNLRNQKYGNALVAGAGVGTNLFLAIFFGLAIRLLPLPNLIIFVFAEVVNINLALGIFNLLPIPPLDGSKILFDFFPRSALTRTIEQYGFIFLIIFVLYGFSFISPIITGLFSLLTGFAT